ncbi:MAG: D-aminoacyl-tRNA deacylase [Acutalibacteraceae bacterium]
MRAVIQRVKNASVSVDGEVVGKIEKGFLVLLGVKNGDKKEMADLLAKKIVNLRVFSDENDKMNLSLRDIGGEILSVSQFTLYADCKKGRRPNFLNAENPKEAEEMYDYFNSVLLSNGAKKVSKGVFGADMKVSLINDGPVTIILDTDELM